MIPTPMKHQWFLILLSLSERPLHGYGIQRAVLDRTDDALRLWPAMLYRSLATIESEGLIEPVSTPPGEPEDERRQYYALTSPGRARLVAEGKAMAGWAAEAREAATP